MKGVVTLSEKPEFNRKDVETVSRSPEAKKLLQMLQKDGGNALSDASEALKKGDYSKAAAMLKPLLEAPDTEILLQELSRKLGRS